MFQCKHRLHLETTEVDCLRCPDYFSRGPEEESMRHLCPETNVPDLSHLIDYTLPADLPPDFAGWPSYAEAFRILFHRRSLAPPPSPDFRGRGIVTCAGGWRFFPGVYIQVRALRKLGCDWPVQIWYLGDNGEFDPQMGEIMKPWGPVEWIDAHSFCREKRIHRRMLGGWELKPFAVAHSPFREVLYMDADCYPTRHPEAVFGHPEYAVTGAVFWPDQNQLQPGQWERFGVTYHADDPGFESGQFAVNKGVHWRPLWLCDWMNDHSDYVYRHLYGDKDTFLLAWRKCGAHFAVPRRTPGFHVHSYIQPHWDGAPMFVHRTRDKFRYQPHDYNTAQVWSLPQKLDDMPGGLEAFTFRCYDELRGLLSLGDVACRADTWDRDIWEQVTVRNEYQIGDFGERDVVLDIGAHIGSFTWLAHRRGCAHVVAVEPDPESYVLLCRNVSGEDVPRTTFHNAAAWRSDVPANGSLPLSVGDQAQNTGGRSLLRPTDGALVQTIPFDDLVRAAASGPTKRVRLVKLDCEGSEYPCLYTSRTLGLIDEIVGEYHDVPYPPEWASMPEAPAYNFAGLSGFLRGQGFKVRIEQRDMSHGLFWATRLPAPA